MKTLKTISFILLILVTPVYSISQVTLDLKGVVIEKISKEIPANTKIELTQIKKETIGGRNLIRLYMYINSIEESVEIKYLDKIEFDISTPKDFWQHQIIKNKAYESIINKGMQYKLRKELEEEALDYINYTESNNYIFKDSYLESYLYTIINKIYPIKLGDGRPGILNIKILKSTNPNAFIFSNGTMFITTGLLSTISSEEELIGIIAHEISHFVLDHSIQNINEATQRKKRAEFWAAFATGVAAATDVYLASNNEYYAPGTLTIGTAVLAYSIASELNERMGLKYSREQEMEADKCAKELMQYLKIDPTALSSALIKIKSISILNGNYLALTGEGTHPAIDDRINIIGGPTTVFNSLDYDRTMSFVNSFNAIVEFNNRHLESCEALIKRNIASNVAVEDDYVLLAMITTFMYDNELKNKEALSYITTAKSLNITPSINLYKQEALVLLRLKRNTEAIESLKNYINDLKSEESIIKNIKNSREWSNVNNYLYNEKQWAIKMINKVKHM